MALAVLKSSQNGGLYDRKGDNMGNFMETERGLAWDGHVKK